MVVKDGSERYQYRIRPFLVMAINCYRTFKFCNSGKRRVKMNMEQERENPVKKIPSYHPRKSRDVKWDRDEHCGSRTKK